MHKQTMRIVLYSSISIALLTLVWGFRQIPKEGHLADQALRASLEQESIVLNSAVNGVTQALKYRLLDVLKAEGNDHPTRAFEDSPFHAATLLEWDQMQWKSLWYSSKSKTELQSSALKAWMNEWPLSKIPPDEVYFSRINDVQGQAYFAIIVPVRRPSQIPMLGVGIFPVAQFGLAFSADQSREVRIFNDQGFALALTHPAYLGTSVQKEFLAQEILAGDEVTLRQEWKADRGTPMLGIASRIAGSNLFATIETKAQSTSSVQAWLYLLLCALGAGALNWVLFSRLLHPLLAQLNQVEVASEQMRRNLHPRNPAGNEAAFPKATLLAKAKLPDADFIEPETVPHAEGLTEEPGTSLQKVVLAGLRALNPIIQQHQVQVIQSNLQDLRIEAEPLQLQTAIEEILKNAIEAMNGCKKRTLIISGKKNPDSIRLTVEDTGIGIPSADLSKVFDPFFSSKDSEGVARGLGLNVVRRVVEELSGTIKIQSHQTNDHSGTRVDIDFPWSGSAVTSLPEHLSDVGRELEGLASEITGHELAKHEAVATLANSDHAHTPHSIPQRQWADVPIRKPKVRVLD